MGLPSKVEAVVDYLKDGDIMPDGIQARGLCSIVYDRRCTPINLNGIQQKISQETRTSLPEKLIQQLGLDKLRWQRLGQRIRPILDLHTVFIGRPEGYNSTAPLPMQDALGVIAIMRTPDRYKELIEISEIKVSGVTRDSQGVNRIVGAAYRPTNGLYSFAMDVSVTEQEAPKDRRHPFFDFSTVLPCELYEATAGFYTKAMVEQTRDGGSSHSAVIKGSDWVGLRTEAYLGPQAIELGFYTKDSKQGRLVGYRDKWVVMMPHTPVPVVAQR